MIYGFACTTKWTYMCKSWNRGPVLLIRLLRPTAPDWLAWNTIRCTLQPYWYPVHVPGSQWIGCFACHRISYLTFWVLVYHERTTFPLDYRWNNSEIERQTWWWAWCEAVGYTRGYLEIKLVNLQVKNMWRVLYMWYKIGPVNSRVSFGTGWSQRHEC